MTAGTTDTNKKSMATLHVEDTIDSGHVYDGISEEHNVHRLDLLLIVESIEFLIKELTKLVEVSDLLIHLHFFVFDKEIDKYGITLLISHAVLRVVHLKLLLELRV